MHAMYRQVFSNRWIALLFVVMTAAGAASLVGTEDRKGALDHATEQLQSQQAEFEEAAEELSNPVKPADESGGSALLEFTSDEELIDMAQGDEASGFDPNPDPIQVFEPVPDTVPEPVLVEPNEDGMVLVDDSGQ